jgi:hypothetical protein
MNHNLIFSAIWLSGVAVDFIIVRAYWKINNCWGKPADIFWAAILSVIGGSWLGVAMGLILMGPPWKPNKIL